MKIREALREGRSQLVEAGLDPSEHDAEVLLRHVLGIDRAHLYEQLADDIPGADLAAYRDLLGRRSEHEPTAYIVGHREFFGLEFLVTPAVLIPRPETETLVETLIAFATERYGAGALTVADVGVGAGTIAVAVAVNLPNARIIATDQSAAALALARENAERHGVVDRVTLVEGDLLTPVREPAEIIAANLPYVRSTDWEVLPREIREHEPRAALDGGPDGLEQVRRMMTAAPARLTPQGAVFCEIGDGQGETATALARGAFPAARIEVMADLGGLPRVLCVYS